MFITGFSRLNDRKDDDDDETCLICFTQLEFTSLSSQRPVGNVEIPQLSCSNCQRTVRLSVERNF